MSETKPSDSAIWAVVESFLGRFRRGERPALTELIGQHPEIADQLLEIIPAVVEMEQLGDAAGPYSGGRAAGPPTDHPESLGDYKILRRIGGGGMGVVYEAEHGSLKSRVALKVIHPRFRADENYLRRFRVEARSAAGLHHTNIVSVFDYGEQDGVFYYAMQYIQGQPLDLVLDDLRRLRAEERSSGAGDPQGSGPAAEIRARRRVSEGLLTGRFGPDAPTGLLGDDASPSTLVEVVASNGDPAGSGDDCRDARPRESASFGSTSLGGPVEGRYYREVARIGAQVADALDHAHRARVLHRDIKPSNLLLDALGNVWVTDFGLAKLEGGEDASKSQDLVGTLRYMAPERFRGVSGRSGDIYALGATLYELATLRPAFEGSDQVRLIDQIVHEPPDRPRAIDRRVPRDLETIVLKALAKDPADRFGSARELAEELGKFVEGHPIQSRPITAAERFYRWCRRNPWLATANISAAALTLALAIGSIFAAKFFRDGQERYAALASDLSKSEVRGRERLFEALTTQARASRFSREVGQRFGSLSALSEALKIGRELGLPAGRFDALRDEAIACLMLPDMKPEGRKIGLPQGLTAWAFDADFTRYATMGRDGTIVVRGVGDDRELSRFVDKVGGKIQIFELNRGGRFLASQHHDNTLAVWDVDLKALAWSISGIRPYHSITFHPDGRRVAVAVEGGAVLVRDLVDGRSRRWEGLKDAQELAYRPDGAELAVVVEGSPTTCRILDAETGRELRAIPIPHDEFVAWSDDGSTLALLQEGDDKVLLYNASRGERGATIELTQFSGGTTLAFHPGGTLLASCSWDDRLHLFDAATGRERLAMPANARTSHKRMQFSRDGRILLQRGPEVESWRVEPAVEYVTLRYASTRGLNSQRNSIHRDGRIVSVGTNRGVILWDLARRAELGFLPIGNAWHSAFEPSGDLITHGEAGLLRWPVRVEPTGGGVRVGPPRVISTQGSDCGIATDRTGRIVAWSGYSYARVAIEGRTIDLADQPDCRGVSLSPDGRWLATGHHGQAPARIWSLPDATLAITMPEDAGPGARFSPDGRWLASMDVPVSRIWEVGSWKEVRRIEGTFEAFSPDGRLGVFQNRDSILALVEIATGRVLARLERPDRQRVGFIAFSPDGSRLVMTSKDIKSTLVVDLRRIRRGLAELGLDWDAPAFPEDDPARPDLPPLPAIHVDYGYLGPDAVLIQVLAGLDGSDLKKLEPVFDALERALEGDPSNIQFKRLLATCCNNLAWELATKFPSSSNLDRAMKLSFRAVGLEPGNQVSLNTRGVVLYRAGQFAEAVTVLAESLAAGRGQFDGFDLYFLAMAHHRLGHREEARRSLDRAIAWVGHQASLSAQYAGELAAFRAEAEAVLAGPAGELPDDVFQRR